MMVLAGLDIATVSGIALFKNGVVTTQIFRAGDKKKFLDVEDKPGSAALDGAKEGRMGRRFEDFLQTFLIDNAVEYVAVEAPLPSNPVRRKTVVDVNAGFAGQAITHVETAGTSLSAIYRIFGLSYLAVSTCSRLNIPCVLVGQGTWRKEFLGDGRATDAKKKAKAMCKSLGIECSNEDAAEAAGIVTWLHRTMFPYAKRAADDLFAKSG